MTIENILTMLENSKEESIICKSRITDDSYYKIYRNGLILKFDENNSNPHVIPIEELTDEDYKIQLKERVFKCGYIKGSIELIKENIKKLLYVDPNYEYKNDELVFSHNGINIHMATIDNLIKYNNYRKNCNITKLPYKKEFNGDEFIYVYMTSKSRCANNKINQNKCNDLIKLIMLYLNNCKWINMRLNYPMQFIK